MSRRVGMGVIFYPRGGSAQVIRYLAAASLARVGWTTELVCGSLGQPGERTHAESFYTGLAVTAADYDAAVARTSGGARPAGGAGAHAPLLRAPRRRPDRLLASVTPEVGAHLADFWAGMLRRRSAGLGRAPPPPPHAPPRGHRQGAARGSARDPPPRHGAQDDRPRAERAAGAGWEHAASLDRRDAPVGLRQPALHRDLSPRPRRGRSGCWASIREGHVGPERRRPERFDRREPDAPRSASALAGVARGRAAWVARGRRAGQRRYRERDLARFVDPETGAPGAAVRRSLHRGQADPAPHSRVRGGRASVSRRPAPLVIWGGFPGECEGEHPHTVAERRASRTSSSSGGAATAGRTRAWRART